MIGVFICPRSMNQVLQDWDNHSTLYSVLLHALFTLCWTCFCIILHGCGLYLYDLDLSRALGPPDELLKLTAIQY